jgi:intracellular sulfur oxidation DsrE/DsrF family protein
LRKFLNPEERRFVDMDKTILISSEFMGDGPEELGRKMIGNFLRKLSISKDKPYRIIFYGSAVKLLIHGSPVLDALDALDKAGVDIIACATCIGYYNLRDQIVVGRVSDMQEFVSVLIKSAEVISIR